MGHSLSWAGTRCSCASDAHPACNESTPPVRKCSKRSTAVAGYALNKSMCASEGKEDWRVRACVRTPCSPERTAMLACEAQHRHAASLQSVLKHASIACEHLVGEDDQHPR